VIPDYVDYDFIIDCKQKLSNLNRLNMFDAAFEWVPFLNSQTPVDGGAFGSICYL